METPFTIDQFTGAFRQYNETVFPMQVIFYLLGLICIFLITKVNTKSSKIISSVLAFFWLWMGIIYHIIFFSPINPSAYFFGSAFIIQGALFMVYGVFQDKLSFKYQHGIFGISGIFLIVIALIIYPLLGFMIGHTYPFSPTFGLPCPTTIFTFGLLLLSDKKSPWILFIIPFLWSIMGFSAVILFGFIEDSLLLISSLVAVSLLIFRHKKRHHIPETREAIN